MAPIREFGFVLIRRHFIDSICLRYGWDLKDVPLHCDCGSKFSVEHALSCLKGGFLNGHHNEIRDFTASLLTEMCNEVAVEPILQPVQNKDSFPSSSNVSDDARLYIGVNGFWEGKYKRCFIDVRVFNPHAQSNRANELRAMYAKHEKEKRIRLYERRILGNELASFTHLVFLVTGGMANECDLFYQRLASMISSKCNQPYSQTLNWIQCSISFILLRSSIQCIRGARSSFHHPAHQPIDLVTAESD